jgi:hypothetical protein
VAPAIVSQDPVRFSQSLRDSLSLQSIELPPLHRNRYSDDSITPSLAYLSGNPSTLRNDKIVQKLN